MLPTISMAQLKKMSVKEITDIGCMHLTADGEYLGTFVVNCTGGMKIKINALCEIIEAAHPKEAIE